LVSKPDRLSGLDFFVSFSPGFSAPDRSRKKDKGKKNILQRLFENLDSCTKPQTRKLPRQAWQTGLISGKKRGRIIDIFAIKSGKCN